MKNTTASATRTGFVKWSPVLAATALAGALAVGGLATFAGTTWDSAQLVAASADTETPCPTPTATPPGGPGDISDGTAWD
jgi:hypothetical protein